MEGNVDLSIKCRPFESMNVIFQEMNQKAATGDATVNPDPVTYNIVQGEMASERILGKAEKFTEERLLQKNGIVDHDRRVTFKTS